MRRLVLLLVVAWSLVASCGALRRPPNDEITIRSTEPPPEAKTKPAERQPPPEQCPASQPER
jgi:hypothetical protein